MKFVHHDGGRAEAGWKGEADDCTCRAITIATGLPYQQVYDRLNELAKLERPRKGTSRSSARNGVKRATYDRFLNELGWTWTPTMLVGQGCTVHLKAGELPSGRLIVRVSKHHTTVIDGVIYDTHDPSRDETRCVYGYWSKGENS